MKKCTVQEFNQNYMMTDEKEMIFEVEYPSKEQFDYITDRVVHEDVKEYSIEHSADLGLINMGEIGKYRLDGVPFGFNAFIITIEESDNRG